MTPIQLSQTIGITPDAIMTQARRMKRSGALNGYDNGFGRNKELPEEVIDFYQKGEPQKAKDEKPKPQEAKKDKSVPQEAITPREEVVEEKQGELFDLGELVFFHPSAKFFYVLVLICCQSWIFASLAEEVYKGNDNHLSFAALFICGLLVEFGGVMLSKVYGKGGDREIGNVWLFVFAAWQIIVDLSYFGLLGSYSDTIGKYVIAVSVPLGILVYSVIYFNKK